MLRQVLEDRVLLAVLAGFLGAAALLGTAVVDAAGRVAVITILGQITTAITAALFWWPAPRDPAERRLFWGIGLSLSLWTARFVTVRLGLGGQGGFADPALLIGFLSYLIYVLAAESAPDRPRRGRDRFSEWTLTWPAAALFTLGLLAYFVWIPAANSEAAGGFLPFMGFEIYLAVRFVQLALWARSVRWRMLYGLLALSDLGFAVSTFYAGRLMSGAVSLTGSALDVVWILPFLPATLVARLRLADLPTEEIGDDLGPEPLIAPREQLVPVVLVLPLLHAVGYAADLLEPTDRYARDLLVAGWLTVMGTLAAIQFRRLSTQARRLSVDAALAARGAEENEERLRLENRLVRAQRLETLGVLAGGVAHDLNNVLSPILGSVAAMAEEKAGGTESVRLLGVIESSARHGSDLTRQLLSFARGSGGEWTTVPVSKVVGDVEHLVRATFPDSIEVEVSGDSRDAMVRCEPAQLRQVLLNLCLNARDAMEDVGRLTIRSWVVGGEPVGPGRVLVSVGDTGPGVAPQDRERLFEPFFTTKAAERGLGLGLAVARSIVASHGGTLELESAPGRGAEFRIELPLAAAGEGDREEEPPAKKVRPAPGRGELILIVDDERVLRDFTSGVLEASGYRTLVAADGETAIELFSQRQAEIRAAVVDRMMPGLDGSATVRELHRLQPGLPVIFVSGIVDVSVPAPEGVSDVLRKPFEIDDLLSALHLAIHGDG